MGRGEAVALSLPYSIRSSGLPTREMAGPSKKDMAIEPTMEPRIPPQRLPAMTPAKTADKSKIILTTKIY